MNGTCQTCGTVAPIEWFLAEAEYRQICAALIELPKDVQAVVFHYLGLFRPVTGRAIAAKKAGRLLAEIRAMVATGYVQIDKKAARPCPPRIWAKAIEQMAERRDRLNLPMPNHNYLKSIAYDLADVEDAKAERIRPIPTTRQPVTPNTEPADPQRDPIERARRAWDAKHGSAENTGIPGPLSSIVKGMD